MIEDASLIALIFLFVLGLASAAYYYRAGWGKPETSNLGILIEQRTRALQESKWRLEESNRTLEQAKQELEQSNQALVRTKAQLEQANRTLEQRVRDGIAALREAERMAAYGQMVAGVAHEVRHPIFALSAATYVIADRLAGNEEVAVQLKIIDHETKRMNALMADLLEFARPQSLLIAPAAPSQLLHEAMETFRAAHPGAPAQVLIEAADPLPKVGLDRARMLQALINLMENARNHASGLTTITLRAGQPSAGRTMVDHMSLHVHNDGRPISPEALPRIFEPFFTGGRGTGLGLAIVRRIVEEHGGTIGVTSDLAHGTEFTIDLPVRNEAP